jgi:hypothetical protein
MNLLTDTCASMQKLYSHIVITLFQIFISLFSYTNLSLQPEAYPSVTVYLHDFIVCILVFIMNISEKLDS